MSAPEQLLNLSLDEVMKAKAKAKKATMPKKSAMATKSKASAKSALAKGKSRGPAPQNSPAGPKAKVAAKKAGVVGVSGPMPKKKGTMVKRGVSWKNGPQQEVGVSKAMPKRSAAAPMARMAGSMPRVAHVPQHMIHGRNVAFGRMPAPHPSQMHEMQHLHAMQQQQQYYGSPAPMPAVRHVAMTPAAQVGRNANTRTAPMITPPAPAPGTQILVCGIPLNVTEAELKEAFSSGVAQNGAQGVGVTYVCILRDLAGRNTGKANIRYSSAQEAKTAIQVFNGGELNKKKITVILDS